MPPSLLNHPLQMGLCGGYSKICMRRRQNRAGSVFHEAMDDGVGLGAGAAESPKLVQPVASWAIWPLLEADGEGTADGEDRFRVGKFGGGICCGHVLRFGLKRYFLTALLRNGTR